MKEKRFLVLGILAMMSAASLFLAGCPQEEDVGDGENSPLNPSTPTNPKPGPELDGTDVTYNFVEGGGGDTTTGTKTVKYTFKTDVTIVASSPNWTVNNKTNRNVVIATFTYDPDSTEPETVGKPETLTLTVKNTNATDDFPVTVMLVGEKFSRPGSEGPAVSYTVVYADQYGAVCLKTVTDDTTHSESVTSRSTAQGDEDSLWYYVNDEGLKNIFNAIYTPNAPNTTDAIENDKTTVDYTEAISKAVLSLFTVTVGEKATKIEIKGKTLPDAPGNATPAGSKLIVIDVGQPGTDNAAANADLPKFYIPHQGLGSNDGNYQYIRLRVNSGAKLVIEADNSGYTANGAGHPCEAGYFNGGCVEVMAGGKLRDGAYEGFPLGANAVILNRESSYLAVGSESSFDASTNGYVPLYDRWYEGWLIGPADETNKPRIVWNARGEVGYIEVRPGELAIDADVTVKKSVGLIYSVWFVDGTTVIIDALDDTGSLGINDAGTDIKGLAVNIGTGATTGTVPYLFYGNNNEDKNTSIIVKPGSSIMNYALAGTLNVGTAGVYTTVYEGSESITITPNDTGNAGTYASTIIGYNSWTGWGTISATANGGD
jgi:hypothetical protein